MNTQDLIRQWEGMSPRQRDAVLSEEVLGIATVADVYTDFYTGGEHARDEFGIASEKYEYDGGAVDYKPVPRYTSSHAPRSLLDGLEAKAIELTGPFCYGLALIQALGIDGTPNDAYPYTLFDQLIRATAEQRALACYLAVKGRSEGE